MTSTPHIAFEDLRLARILIVDDNETNILLLQKLLQHDGYKNLTSLTDSRVVINRCESFRPDIVLLDYHMPYFSGSDVLEQLASSNCCDIPVIILTADVSEDTRRAALKAGARDFLTKPLDPIETLLRVKNLLETRVFQSRLEDERNLLERRVLERTQDLQHAQAEIVDRLAYAAEFRDDDTRQHTQRVGLLAARVAQQLGLPEDEVALLRRAVPLHDIGKIGIPDAILLKPGRLTPDEMFIMRTHVVIGAEILDGARFPLLQLAQQIALTHHERWDGKGYPRGLAGTDIPLPGRLTAVIDVFDALTSQRPYKEAWPMGEAIAEIEKQAGSQFDPTIVEAFLAVITNESEREKWYPQTGDSQSETDHESALAS